MYVCRAALTITLVPDLVTYLDLVNKEVVFVALLIVTYGIATRHDHGRDNATLV